MTTGAIYGNFRNRDELLLALGQTYWPPIKPKVRPGASFPEVLRALAKATLAVMPERRGAAVGRFTGLAYALTHEELRGRVVEFTRESYAFGAEWLRSVVREEDLPMTADQFVRVVHALSEGLVFARLVTPELVPDAVFYLAFGALGGEGGLRWLVGPGQPLSYVRGSEWGGDCIEVLVPDRLYALTGIFCLRYIFNVESVFEVIAEPNRRAILGLLVASEQSVGEIERQLRMSQPAVSKHLRVLRDAGFVEATVDGQRRLYRLRPEPLQELDAWLAPFRRFWEAHLDALERHLDRMESKTKSRRKR